MKGRDWYDFIWYAANHPDLNLSHLEQRMRQTGEVYLQELLGLPEEIKVECILGIGHPAEEKSPVPADNLQRSKMKHNRWSSKMEENP